MQNQRDIERPGGRFRGLDAVQHPQKIGRVAQRAVGRHDLLALADAVVNGHDHGDLRGQVVGLAHVGVVGVVLFVGVVEAERRNRRAQHFHGRGRGRKAAQQVDDPLVERPRQSQLGGKFAQRELVGKDAVPEQIGGFLEGRVLRQLVDIDAPIGQHARLSIDPANSGVRRNNSFQTLTSDSSGHHPFDLPLPLF